MSVEIKDLEGGGLTVPHQARYYKDGNKGKKMITNPRKEELLVTLTNQELKAVWLATNKDFEGKHMTHGVHIYSKGDEVVLEATDSHIVVRFTKYLGGEVSDFDLVVSNAELKPLIKGGKSKKREFGLFSKEEESEFMLSNSELEVEFSSLITETQSYPDIENVFCSVKTDEGETFNGIGFDLEKMATLSESLCLVKSKPVVKTFLPEKEGLPIYLKDISGQWEALIMPCRINR